MEQLTTASGEKYFTEEELQTGEAKCKLVFKLINGYIAYLGKSERQVVERPTKFPTPNS